MEEYNPFLFDKFVCIFQNVFNAEKHHKTDFLGPFRLFLQFYDPEIAATTF